jgi:type I restriction enzyme M protein
LCDRLDAREYKHVVLGLIFRKYISDAFSELDDILPDKIRVKEAEKIAAKAM